MEPGQGTERPLINIHRLANGEYHLLLGGAGFGPTLRPGTKPVPDLVFGGTGGVCHAVYSRYCYQNGHYMVDACNQEKEGKVGNCAIIACELRNFPTFSNPFPEQHPSPKPSRQPLKPGCDSTDFCAVL